MKVLPDEAELQFVEIVATGTVHITCTVPLWRRPEPKPAEISGNGRSWADVAMAGDAALTVLCGKRTFPHLPATTYDHRFTNQFDDELLCRACYRCLPEADRYRAFEHPQSSDAEKT